MRKASFSAVVSLPVALLGSWLGVLSGVRAAESDFTSARRRMVEQQLAAPDRGITNARVLAVMGKVPRHEFVPAALRAQASGDHPLPLGHGQTISQPFIVAFMTEKLEPQPQVVVAFGFLMTNWAPCRSSL